MYVIGPVTKLITHKVNEYREKQIIIVWVM